MINAVAFNDPEHKTLRVDLSGQVYFVAYEWLRENLLADAYVNNAPILVELTNWAREGGSIDEYAPPPPTLEDYRRALQAHIDERARERQYDSIISAVSYVGSPNPQWAAEAEALRDWRDAVWSHATAEFAKVQAAEREPPSVVEFLTELPKIVWPE